MLVAEWRFQRPGEEGRDGVRGVERQHLRDDRKDRREAEWVLRRVLLHGSLEELEQRGAVAPARGERDSIRRAVQGRRRDGHFGSQGVEWWGRG